MMVEKRQDEHDAQIVWQFTKQTIPFAELPGHLDSIQMLIEMSKVGGDGLKAAACVQDQGPTI